MSEFELAYGSRFVSLAYDEARFRVLEAKARDERPLSDAEIGARLDAPIDSPPLEEIIEPGASVLIVVSDATRATASAQVVNLLVRRLIALGVAPFDINLIFATGIHRPVTLAEKRELLTPFILQRIKTIDHDALDASSMIQIGVTRDGTPLEVNRALKEHDHVILTGGVGFHYFAGFTGGRKSICPGLASARTIETTHLLALDFERGGRRPGVGAGLLDGNAVHEECERVAELIAPSFLINTVVNERGQATRIYAGDLKGAHRRACAEYGAGHSVEIEEKRRAVIASCGGSPWDINLIQAHKALDMAAHACAEGGDIILLAECVDGLGREDFLKWFEAIDSRALEDRLHEHYEVNGQSAWALLVKAEKFRVHLVSELADEDVKRMHLHPARTMDEAVARIDTNASGYIMPRASSLLPVVSG